MTTDPTKPLESEVVEEANENGPDLRSVAITDQNSAIPGIRPRNPDGTWPKGVSGNLSGRPQTRFISDAYRKLLRLSAADLDAFDPVTAAEALALTLVKNAIANGDIGVARELADRTEGKVPMAEEDRTALTPGGDVEWLYALLSRRK
jgi:hypothetical protein